MCENLEIVFSQSRIVAGFTNRLGGVSEGKFSSLNLGDHVGDNLADVIKNREILAQNLGVKKLKFMKQIHSDKVFILENEDDELPECDAVITNLSDIGICVLVADCSPVVIIDERQGVIGVAHAGRAGVMLKICTKAVMLMGEKFGSKADEISVFVGANIKGGCYEVGELQLGEFNAYKIGRNFNMNTALKDEFKALGVRNLNFSEVCTHCDERYFSYRRDGVCGRFCGFAVKFKDKNGI
ncbi:peptidoglycan editing factor PgeF [Campylobacter concisus]|uniref:peptidoglycan editing factor PgeF n=1 Tax=Campylobacter concisus TaxID=199 RepID=UPI00122D413B|nr:peptidoglycan editing factor PgeF [Campylobacter concisus]